jgi:hypothetical protein
VAKLSWQRWAAIAGVAYVVLQIIMTVLFFVGGAPPPLADTARWAAYAERDAGPLLWIGFVNGLSYTVLLVFAVGVRRVLAAFGEAGDIFGEVFYGAAILAILTNLVGGSLIGAVGLDAASRPEPSALRALYEGGGSLIGVFALFPLALMLIAGAAGFQQRAVFPRSLVWIGYAAGVLSLAATPALFGGSDPTDLYSATGVAGLAMGLLPLVIWVTAVSIALWRQRRAA